MKYINCPVCRKQLMQLYCSNIMIDDVGHGHQRPADRYDFWCDNCDIEIGVVIPREPKITVIK